MHKRCTLCLAARATGNEPEDSPSDVFYEKAITVVCAREWFMFLASERNSERLICLSWLTELRHWSLFYENGFTYCICPKRFSKLSFTKYLPYVLSVPFPGDPALRPSKEMWDELLCEEAKQDI